MIHFSASPFCHEKEVGACAMGILRMLFLSRQVTTALSNTTSVGWMIWDVRSVVTNFVGDGGALEEQDSWCSHETYRQK